MIGDTLTLTATVLPADATDKSVTWESDNENAATVADGVVTGVAVGTATITVTTVDGNHTATCDITVTATAVAVTGVTLNKTTLTLEVDGTEQLTPTIAPVDATNTNVTWESDTEAVATVSATGLVTAVSAGTATITVTTDDGGKTATCDVTVNAAAPTVDGIKDAAYTTAASPANDGGGNSWGTNLDKLSYYSDGTNLYIFFNFATVGNGNNVYLFIDNESIATGSDPSAVDCTGWGALSVGDNVFTNTNGFNCDFSAVGWRFDGSEGQTPAGKFNIGNVSKLISGTLTDISATVSHSVSADFSGYEFKIPYSAIGSGASSGQTVRALVFFGKNGNTDDAGDASWGGIRSTIPALTGTAANSYLTDINKAVTFALE